MGQKKASNKIIRLDPFPFDIMVHFGDKKQLEKTLGKYGLVENTIARTLMLDTNQVILYLKEKPKDINGYSLLAHEIFHCVDLVLRKVGISLSDDSDEIYAYCIQYLTKQIYIALKIK